MKTYLIILIAAFTIFSCENKELKNNITYKSSDNDISDIKLIIDKNHSFKMNMEIFPDLDDENGKSTFENYNGTWTKKGKFIHLKFKTKGVHLNYLFDPRENDKEKVELINLNTVAIKEEINDLIIWGIFCERE